ncbi:MAG: hypothetical protein QOH62_2079, partial [Solirubrobacteraceae bacterium]|nr:hypothetical protein [Solirubrobacteraceae bacterium]
PAHPAARTRAGGGGTVTDYFSDVKDRCHTVE